MSYDEYWTAVASQLESSIMFLENRLRKVRGESETRRANRELRAAIGQLAKARMMLEAGAP